VSQGTRIQLCGRLTVEWDGERLERALPGRQGRLLFAYLVLHRGRPVRRDELIDALWSEEGPPPSGDALLAPPLSRLRKALGSGRLEGRGELTLELPADAWIDWEVARDGVERARVALREEDWAAAWEPAQAALAIADRGLLPGLEATWIDERRTELADLRLEALEAVATVGVHLGGAELPVAEQAARAAVEAAPFRESARLALMEALRARGNVAEALRAYEDLRVLLREELGTTPGPALVALHERLLHADTGGGGLFPATLDLDSRAPRDRPSAPSAALPDRLAAAAATPLVGRADALARLQEALGQARAGQTGLVLILGEGGIGKTRLIAELARGAEDFAVLYGRCDEEELFPFGPWIEMLVDHLAKVPDDELGPLLGDHAPDLARLVPALRTRLPGLAEPPASDPETQRQRLFGAFTGLIPRLAQRSPLVMVVDDLHWADRSSLQMGRQLVRSAPLGPVLMLGTYRDTELHPGHPLTEVLADLEREVGELERLRLEGLGEHEVAEIVGDRAEAETVRRIREETGGNPFFVKQLARHLDAAGTGVPAGVRDVIARNVARLPEEAGRSCASARSSAATSTSACSSGSSTSPRTTCSTCSTRRSAPASSSRSRRSPGATRSPTRCCARRSRRS
jgi:DNA-binding SARP family transcriptional activator